MCFACARLRSNTAHSITDDNSCGLEVAATSSLSPLMKQKRRKGRWRRTYVSGNSTGLVLILLCKANMYSSINGHCGEGGEGKTTARHIELLRHRGNTQRTSPSRQNEKYGSGDHT